MLARFRIVFFHLCILASVTVARSADLTIPTDVPLKVGDSIFIKVEPSVDLPIPTNGLVLWLRADEGIQEKDGTITTWQDYSGNAHHATRDSAFSTNANNPKRILDFSNGHTLLKFDGSDICFTFPRITNIQTVVWVVAKDSLSFGQHNERFVLGDSIGKDFHVGTHKTAFILNPGESSASLRKGVVRLNGKVVDPLTTDFPKSLGIVSMVATGNVSADQIGKDRKFKDRSWQGRIAEIILYDRPLKDDERQQLEKSLSEKYQILSPSGPVSWVHPKLPCGPGLSHHILASRALGNEVGFVVCFGFIRLLDSFSIENSV